jgi:NADH:ubiquinone oxidoreductase subunit 3 (subunit A)
MYMGAVSLIALVLAAVFFSAGGILVGKILLKKSYNPQKGQAYECGIPTQTSPWQQFHVVYFYTVHGLFICT